MATSWIIIAIVAFTMFLQGDAITCWTCGSATQRECGDDVDTSKLTEVTDCKYCTKEKIIDTYGFHSIRRSCLSSDGVDAMGLSEVKLGCVTCKQCGQKSSNCLCDTDKCNHATTAVISLVTMVLALTFFKLFQ